jgi:DNA-binding response OmpR family regulator
LTEQPAARDVKAKSALLAHMRHELRTPVNAILGYSEMLLEDAETAGYDATFVADLRKIHGAGETLLALINDILDAAKIEQRKDLDLKDFGVKIRHGLRTPVDAVIGYSEMLLEDAPPTVAADLQKILTSGQRLLALIEDVVRQAGMEAGRGDSPGGSPAVSDSVSTMIQGVMSAIRPAEDRAAGDTGKLLVVDDNEINRDMLSRRLERQGHTVATAPSGREALDRLQREEFDLVLLDVMMPEMNGFQVLEHMKHDAALRHIPVIMISALDEIDSVVRCIEMGAEDYLPKNFNPILLRARIGACLEKKRLRDREVLYLRQIEEAKKRSDELLHVILPHEIVEELKRENSVKPKRYENVAVMFCDIVGFTPYCAKREPEEIVGHLQQLVEAFEALAVGHDLQKIKTIGDSFMATAGAVKPLENPVLNAVRCGLDMVATSRKLPAKWEVRCGIHVGPVMAGIVGHRQYLFDLWGDTVNTAARVESNGVAGAVNVSAVAWKQVESVCVGESRGLISLKGLGDMEVFRVDGFKR